MSLFVLWKSDFFFYEYWLTWKYSTSIKQYLYDYFKHCITIIESPVNKGANSYNVMVTKIQNTSRLKQNVKNLQKRFLTDNECTQRIMKL